MIIETSALSSIGSALWSVYTAYGSIKSNKERCKQLVDRCQTIVDRLQIILSTDHDARVLSRIGDLQKAFKTTEETITKVGQQSYIVSLLRMEENTALIEDAQRALTELITTLSLETIIDVSAWQKENEVAVRKEFAQVRNEIRRLDKNLSNELAAHGTSIGQLVTVIERMEKKHGEPLSVTVPGITLAEGQPRPRSWSSPTAVRPSIASMLDRMLPPDTSDGGNEGNKGTSHAGGLSRTRTSILAPPLSAGCEIRRQPQARLITPSPLAQSHMCVPLTQMSDEVLSDDEGVPDDPPPPYTALSWEDEVAAAYERIDSAPTSPGRSANSRTSIRAVRSFDSEDAAPLSPGLKCSDKSLPDDLLLKVRQSLKRKQINNFSAMKTIGQFGKINTKVLVEMWLFPKNRAFNTAVSLDSFEPLERDKLQLIRSRVYQNRENPSHAQVTGAPQRLYNHVLLLCPREASPTVIIIERKQSVPQQAVKAYILDTIEPMTLVSVIQYSKKSWILIPYYPDMSIRKAKEYVQRYFSGISVTNCTCSGQPSQLSDGSTLLQNGVQAYEHNLSMTTAPIPQ